MKIEREGAMQVRWTLHAYELSALVAAARWVVEGCEGELPERARDELRALLRRYEAASRARSAGH